MCRFDRIDKTDHRIVQMIDAIGRTGQHLPVTMIEAYRVGLVVMPCHQDLPGRLIGPAEREIDHRSGRLQGLKGFAGQRTRLVNVSTVNGPIVMRRIEDLPF